MHSNSKPKADPANTRTRLQGDVLLRQPISFRIITLVTTALLIMLVLLLSQGTYHRKETISGYLISDKGVEKVVTSVVGVIKTQHIMEGTVVKKGDVLFEISTQQDSSEDVSVNQQIIGKLLTSQQEIQNSINNESLVMEAETQRLTAAINNAQSQLIHMQEQQNIQKHQLQLADQEHQKYEQLMSKGYVTQSDLMTKKDAYLRAESNLNQTNRTQLMLKSEIIDLENQLEKLPLLHQNKIQELTQRLTANEQRIIQLKSNDSYSIKANVDGLVTSVQAYPGQRVSNNTYLLSIVPADTLFHAELFLPSKAIGFIERGQSVKIRYDAFPYQQFGQYSGKVLDVAKVSINPDDLDRVLPTRSPVYRVKVILDSQHVNAYGKQMNLQAGMSITADIMLEERTLLDWILTPYHAIRGHI